MPYLSCKYRPRSFPDRPFHLQRNRARHCTCSRPDPSLSRAAACGRRCHCWARTASTRSRRARRLWPNKHRSHQLCSLPILGSRRSRTPRTSATTSAAAPARGRRTPTWAAIDASCSDYLYCFRYLNIFYVCIGFNINRLSSFQLRPLTLIRDLQPYIKAVSFISLHFIHGTLE